MPTNFLTAQQAAAELGLSVRAIQHRITNGTIAAEKLGDGRTSAYVIERTEVERIKSERLARVER